VNGEKCFHLRSWQHPRVKPFNLLVSIYTHLKVEMHPAALAVVHGTDMRAKAMYFGGVIPGEIMRRLSLVALCTVLGAGSVTAAPQERPRSEGQFAEVDRLLAKRDCRGALAHLEKLGDSPSAPFYRRRAGARYCLRQIQEAIDDLTRLLALSPRDWGAYMMRGAFYEDAGRFVEAIADFEQAIALEPTDSNSYNSRAIARQNIGDPLGAIADYTRSLELQPRVSGVHYNRGNAHMLLDRFEEAIADYSQAVALYPSTRAYSGRGVALAALGREAQAMADFEQAERLCAERFPFDCPLVFWRRGEALRRLGKPSAALSQLQLAAEIYRARGDLRSATEVEAQIAELRQQS
jgi:tetratricopeptide (TPR) repeat protein